MKRLRVLSSTGIALALVLPCAALASTFVGSVQSASVPLSPASPRFAGSGMIIINNDAAWTTDRPVTLKLSASSMGGTVTRMRFSNDHTTWTDWQAYAKSKAYTLPAGDAAAKVVWAQFQNSAGDKRIDFDTIGLDTIAPATTDDSDPQLHNHTVTVTLAPADAGSGPAQTSWALDGGASQTGTSVPVAAPADHANDGTHTIAYHSTDVAGNVETSKSCTVKIDTVHDVTPPVTTSDADAFWHNSGVTVHFSVTAAAGSTTNTTHYRVDGGAWQTGTQLSVGAPADHTNDAAHTLEFYTVDQFDNYEVGIKTCAVKIDTGLPSTTDDAPPEWSQEDVLLSLSASDPISATATHYRLDGGSWQGGVSLTIPAAPDKSNDGIHIVDYYSTDEAGNTEGQKSCQVKINVPAIAEAVTVLTSPAGHQLHPALSGGTVVWQDNRNGNWDIHGSPVTLPSEFVVCAAAGDQTSPAISGDNVVWVDARGADLDIRGYSLVAKTEFAICSTAGDQTGVAISGDTVVWADHRGASWDIYGYDLVSKTEFPVCTAAGDQSHPAISGSTIVWADHRGTSSDIYGYDLVSKTEFPVCAVVGEQTDPAVSGDKVIWNDARNAVYLHDLTLKLEYPLSIRGGDELAISGNQVAWSQSAGFAARVDYPTPTGCSFSVAVGDFNADGGQDLVTAGEHRTVSVLLSNGDGTFSAGTQYGTGLSSGPIAIGDFNGDGRQDLAMPDRQASTVSVMFGNGRGGFGNKAEFATGVSPSKVVVGDFNGDGKQDLAVAYGGCYESVSVLLGNGHGSFSTWTDFVVGVGPGSVAVGDFNGDGNQDLVAGNGGSSTVSVLLGTGTGTFGARTDYPAGLVNSVAVGDFNGDGNQDLATTDGDADTVSVLLGTGTGAFGARTDYPTGENPRSVVIGDFNADGEQDMATVNWFGNSVSVLLGKGDGTFSAGTAYATGSEPFSIAVGDFDGDHMQDLVTANMDDSTVSVLLGRRAGVSVYNIQTDSALRVRGSEDAGGAPGPPALDGDTVVWANHGVHGAKLTYPQWTIELEIVPEGGGGAPLAPTVTNVLSAEAASAATIRASVAVPDRWIRSHSVDLALTATSGQGTITGMSLSDGGITYGDWESFVADKPFTLSAGDGIKTVCAVFRDSSGLVSPVVSDMIGIDTHRPTTKAYATSARRGRTATLKYRIADAASPYVPVKVTIKVKTPGGRTVKSTVLRNKAVARTLAWKFRCTLAKGSFKYFVYATDAAGNRQSRVGSARFVVR